LFIQLALNPPAKRSSTVKRGNLAGQGCLHSSGEAREVVGENQGTAGVCRNNMQLVMMRETEMPGEKAGQM